MKRKNISKFFKLLLALIVIIPCCFMFTACGKTQTPYIGSNGNWFIGDTDTGVRAEGRDGQDGEDGLPGKDADPIDTYEMYQNAVQYENYTGSYLDFIKENFLVASDITSAVANQCAMSVVAIKARSSSSSANGSGVIYSLDSNGNAYIVTNNHVACPQPATPYSSFKIALYGNHSNFNIDAEYVGGSVTYDIAVLKVTESEILKTSGVMAASLSTNPATLGEACIAIGNTNSLGISVTKGAIGVDSEYVKDMPVSGTKQTLRLLRHDAYIAGGNSGGGLFDMNGKLIGITNGGQSDSDIHYAVPADLTEKVVQSIISNAANKTATTAKLGIATAYTSKTIYNSQSGKIETTDTVTISRIDEGIILQNGTLAVNDKLVSITINPSTSNAKTYQITREFNLKEIQLILSVGTTITITCDRGGQTVYATVTVANTIAVS